ncbi:uncharacterized protein LOC131004044 [Salvia miltiorrhiza]|uniref:uncharacterized protein LOC130991419 n=1 Tax=Salvia miltiorrhiza TaxID=226208 RepID=UPI0025AC954E|nr:uncharacterized protein LOC130991419 [Salvia miltiorrhiza]XP_057776442.1 uncharacterized protein LOC130995245 isoform X2 [Salvia miltiorrhiza]XP_057776444.1 uncharacterized protein LOC130995247 [Salvia miltiorrhiza]XP_057786597.1 uncharacterized protein LOC131004044 [Salvia miltiorrhiza]
MKPKAISQRDVFYIPPWSRPIELLLLVKLDCARVAGKWVPGDHVGNMPVIDSICDELTGHPFLLQIPKAKYHEKVMEWLTRFIRFHSLLKDERTWFCENTKRVFATDLSWEEIGAEKPQMLCYMEEGEANWDILKRLFYEAGMYSCSDEDE